MSYGLPDSTVLKLKGVFARHPEIEQVLLYGSRAKGNFRPGSDIDLTVIGANIDQQLLGRLLTELDELNTPYLMDLSLYQQIGSEALKKHIAEHGKVLYQRQG